VSTHTPASLIQITPDQVIVADRLRAIDADCVAMLAASMREIGQQTPIQVLPADEKGMHRLVAGAHRVAAAQLAGLEQLTATVVDVDDLRAALLEVDENLMRRELSELDRAVFLAKRQEIYLQLHPETGHGKAPKKPDSKVEENFHFARPESFAAATAQKLGVSDRQVRTYLARARIEPALRELLAPTRWADHGATLDALAREKPKTREAMVLALTRAENPARNVSAAYIEAVGAREPVRTETRQRESALASAWRKADRRAQREWLRLELGKPASRALVEEVLAELREQEERTEAEVLDAVAHARSAA